MQVLRTLSLTLCFAALVAAPSSAQQSSSAQGSDMLTADALDAALAGHESAVDRQRAELADLLSSDEVRDVAQGHGIDMGDVGSAVEGLSDSQVRAVNPLVAKVASQVNGNMGSITISVAAVILILLVLILIT